jgi:hypothetical protein
MILRPLVPESDSNKPNGNVTPVWQLVSRMQAAEADQYLLVGQPDHARISGEMAAKFSASFLPQVEDHAARAIGVHDAGWAQFPFERDLAGDPPLTDNGRPQHFMQVPLDESLAAWTGSIKAAGEISPLGEYMVSGHFSRIAKMRMQMELDTAEDVSHLASFVREEEEAQFRLEQRIPLSKRQLSEYVDLLQFADVLSLYLCCGSRDTAEFPQDFRGTRVQIRYEDGVYITTPSIFGETQRFQTPVRIFPSKSGEGKTRIAFHIR